jgi:hypothetical protein
VCVLMFAAPVEKKKAKLGEAGREIKKQLANSESSEVRARVHTYACTLSL